MATNRNIFFVDGLGAIMSALFLWFMTGRLHAYVGMPVPVLNALALAAACFCVYSLSCFFFVGSRWQPFLRAIAMINLLYCFTTFACLVRYWPLLKTPGKIYFTLEILVILALVYVELTLVGKGSTREKNVLTSN
jgi:hypothetical protein